MACLKTEKAEYDPKWTHGDLTFPREAAFPPRSCSGTPDPPGFLWFFLFFSHLQFESNWNDSITYRWCGGLKSDDRWGLCCGRMTAGCFHSVFQAKSHNPQAVSLFLFFSFVDLFLNSTISGKGTFDLGWVTVCLMIHHIKLIKPVFLPGFMANMNHFFKQQMGLKLQNYSRFWIENIQILLIITELLIHLYFKQKFPKSSRKRFIWR